MNLAWRELRRRPTRFVTATSILTLLAILLMFLGGLLDGLLGAATGALRAQRADVIVYSSTAKSSFVRSRITPSTRAQVEQTPGVRAVGGLGLAQLGARVPGHGPRDLADVALFGYELAPRGLPTTPPKIGTGWADDVLRHNGVRTGMTIELGPKRSPVRIVGFVSDTTYSGQGSVWTSPETWRTVLRSNRPDEQLAPGTFQALVVRSVGPAATVGHGIDARTDGATASLTKEAAIEALPGVKEQRGVFNQIIAVTVVIAVLVVALFFALLTVERTSLYGVLKALGARTSSLMAGVVLQASIVTCVACIVGGALAILIDVTIPPGAIPYSLSSGRVVTSSVLLLLAALAGCTFSLRRVVRIDPASAIGSN